MAKHGWPEFVARQTLEAIIARLGLSVRSINSKVNPLITDAPVFCRALGIEVQAGALIGTVDETEVVCVEGQRFSFTMTGRIHREGVRAGSSCLTHRGAAVNFRCCNYCGMTEE